jgi:hypothetical protein
MGIPARSATRVMPCTSAATVRAAAVGFSASFERAISRQSR